MKYNLTFAIKNKSMLETSKDLLYVVLAFCALWLTVFICWGMYYIIAMMRDVTRLTTSVREKFELVDRILILLREKLEHSASHMSMITEAAIRIVNHFMEQGNKKTSKASASTKKKKKDVA